MFHRHWRFVGKYCSNHLVSVVKYFGSTKVETLNIENVELQDKCDHYPCKDFVSFGVWKLVE